MAPFSFFQHFRLEWKLIILQKRGALKGISILCLLWRFLSPWGFLCSFLGLKEKKAHEHNSNILHADADHTFGDFIVSFAVLTSIIFAAFGVYWLDLVVGGIVSVYLIYLAIKILKSNLPDLVDTSPQFNKGLLSKVEDIEGVVDIHKFRARGNMSYMQVDFHLHLNEDLSFKEAIKLGKRRKLRLKKF